MHNTFPVNNNAGSNSARPLFSINGFAEAAAPVEETAPVAAPAVPATEPAPAEASEQPAVGTVTKGKRGRPAGTGKKKASDNDVKRPATVVVYYTDEEKDALQIGCIKSKTKMTNFIRLASMDAMSYTFACNEADCGSQFTMRSSDGKDAPPKATCCPACGSKRISMVKM